MPRCFGTSGSVRTRNSPTSAIWPNEHQIFWPFEHVVVAVELGARAQRREVGAHARLGEALAPHLLAAEDLGEVLRLLRVGPLLDERRSCVQRADEVHTHVGGTGAGRLLVEDQLLGGRRAPPSVLGRPVQTRVAGVEQAALPVGVPAAALDPRVTRRFRRERGQCLLEPHAQLHAKRFVGLRVTQLHGAGSLRVGRLRAGWGEPGLAAPGLAAATASTSASRVAADHNHASSRSPRPSRVAHLEAVPQEEELHPPGAPRAGDPGAREVEVHRPQAGAARRGCR